MRQWVEAAYLTRAFVTRTHEYAFRKGSCDSLVRDKILHMAARITRSGRLVRLRLDR